ncbi:hypothetical protein [Holospora curviuscula]|uniref:Uncharacterized protein n=1 Tax=Holospora curviuscula TaxID=1082868 RepID=A0A2S5RDB0_9PROT|nr:hypothetical protein [Holospora curviuscula]PPE05300.1 hypothetical protein HCUR_00344 [Holospora curviuscula]
MTREQIYTEIRERSPLGVGSDPGLLEALEAFEDEELLEDLEELYQEWGRGIQLNRARKKEEFERIQKCESLFDFITQAIFHHGDPAVIPQLLKYVPSDDTDQDLVFMEDYSSEHICNGITDADYFGEEYIPVLLGCIHELVPRAMRAADTFLYRMILQNLIKFKNIDFLVNCLHLAKRETLLKILDYSIRDALEEIKEKNNDERIENVIKRLKEPIDSIVFDDEGVIQVTFLRQEFLKLHGHDG